MHKEEDHDLSAVTAADFETAVLSLRMLADPTRLRVMWLLRGRELTVSALCRALERPSPAVSQHLAKLRAAGLVATRREGTQIHYRIASSHIGQLVVDALSHTQHTAGRITGVRA
jgi:DNA-binding transcriptional ArsR family regulator